MNVHGVRPGKSVLMIGSGNIGLIVSYQMAQAAVKVAAVVSTAPYRRICGTCLQDKAAGYPYIH